MNALQLRQSLSKMMVKLQRSGEPILLEKGKKPAAVIISMEDFRKRFVEKDADERRRAIQEKILKSARRSSIRETSEEIVRNLRSGKLS